MPRIIQFRFENTDWDNIVNEFCKTHGFEGNPAEKSDYIREQTLEYLIGSWNSGQTEQDESVVQETNNAEAIAMRGRSSHSEEGNGNGN